MDAEFYEEMAETALELLEEFGRTVTLRLVTPGSNGVYDPSKGKAVGVTKETLKDTTRNAVVVDAPENRIGPQYGGNVEAGSRVFDENKWCYMDADGEAPTQSHQVVFDGRSYSIFNVQTYAPAGIPMLYLLVLRA